MSGISGLVVHFPYAGLFLLLVLGGLGFPFPEGATLILGGFLIFSKVIRTVPALVVAYSGILVGDFLSYYFGKKYGRMIVTHRKFSKIISPDKLLKIEEKFNKKGVVYILIGGRLISEIFLVAGILRMPFSKILLVDALSSLLGIFLWTGIGYVGGNSIDAIEKNIATFRHHSTLFIIGLLIIYLFYRKLKTWK